MDKDKKGIIYFILTFLLICFSGYALIWLSPHIPFFDKFYEEFNEEMNSITNLGSRQAMLIGLVLTWLLCSRLLEFILLTILSVFIICKSKNEYLLKIFNTIKIPTIIFALCLIFDISLNAFVEYKNNVYYALPMRQQNNPNMPMDLGYYFMCSSISVCFGWIYIIALINNLRIFIQSRK